MRSGIYETRDGVKVAVRETATGYTITYPDGTVTVIGGAS